MIKNIVKQVEKQPVSTLLVAVAGIAATVAMVRVANENPQYLRAARRRVRQAGERGAELAEDGARWFADNGAAVAGHGSRLADRASERGGELVERSSSILDDGVDAARHHASRRQLSA